MKVYINDKPIDLPDGSTLSQALETAGISPKGIATAVNNNVVQRDNRNSHILNHDDKILIIKAFYGG